MMVERYNLFRMQGESTSDRILFHLKTRGPQAAAQIAKRLAVTPMAVRQHLYHLRDDGMVDYLDERRRVGRPARLWRLTDKAQARFPNTHAELTVELLAAVRAIFGEDGIQRLVNQRTREQIKACRERVRAAGATLEERVRELAKIRSEQGYMAEFARGRDGTLTLIENHCPICAAASTCQGLCREELALFTAVLGDGVSVERVEHILSGARRCAYRITS